VAYWSECAIKKRTDQLTGAKSAVMKVSKYGWGGKTMVKHKLVTHCFQPTMLWDVWCNGKFVLQSISCKHVPKVWCIVETGIP